MKATINNKTHDDLKINTKTYDYLNKGDHYMYHINFKDREGTYYNDYFILRTSIFSGNLNLKFYNDSHKNKTLNFNDKYQYMGDMEYIFEKENLSTYSNGIYV
jgi:hypothetical protein